MRKYFFLSKVFILCIFVLLSFVIWNCSEPKNPGVAHPNQPPVVKLANIPVDDPDMSRPTKTPLVTLYWVGNDADGYVTAFTYRWSYKESTHHVETKWRKWTTVLNYVTYTNRILILDVDEINAPKVAPNIFRYFANIDLDVERRENDPQVKKIFNDLDSGKTVNIQGVNVYASNPIGVLFPVHRSPNSGEFIFESNDSLNYHKFEIFAIDNEHAVSELDSIRFWNNKVPPPIAEMVYDGTKDIYKIDRIIGNDTILVIETKDSVYVLPNTTYTWSGIPFSFRARDPNSRTWEFSWRVDSGAWSEWSKKSTVYVTASHMKPPYTGTHTIDVRVRNEFGSISLDITPRVPRRTVSLRTKKIFKTIFPDFAQPNYEKRILVVHASNHDSANYPYSPDTETMVQAYREILDPIIGGRYDEWIVFYKGRYPVLSELARYSLIYLIQDRPRRGVGGIAIPARRFCDYLDAGGKLIFNGIFGVPLLNMTDHTLLLRRMHLDTLIYYGGSDLNLGGIGYRDYPHATKIDSSKLAAVWQGHLPTISRVEPRGFGEIIYRYVADPANERYYHLFNGKPLGIRYLGATFKTVYFGLPLYFLDKEVSIKMLEKALKDLEHL